jgi:ribosome maturation factor RimP
MNKDPPWREVVIKLVEDVEHVNKYRNIARHSTLSVKPDRPPVLWSIQAAKVMKNMSSGTTVSLDQISATSREAEALLGDCDLIIENYNSANEEIRKRLAVKIDGLMRRETLRES